MTSNTAAAVVDEQLPPFTAPGAAKQYWSVLARAVSTTRDADVMAGEIDPATAVELIVGIAGSEHARQAVAPLLPEIAPDEKLVHIVAFLLQDRPDVLDAAIDQAMSPAPGADEAALRRALPVLLRARVILAG